MFRIEETSLVRHRKFMNAKIAELQENKGREPVFCKEILYDFIDEFNVNENINSLYDKDSLTFNLLSGSIKLNPGSYVLVTGCGCGKTTAVLDLMIKYLNLGVFYSASTIAECDQLYNKLKEFGLEKLAIVIHDKIHTSEDPQYMLSSEIWNKRPEDIANFPIVITTRHKLNSTPPSIF